MSSLWRKRIMNHNKNKRPSPTHSIIFLKPTVKIKNVIKRISVPAFLKRAWSAGMTVEASLVLPLFLFFFLNITSSIEMIRLHGNLQMALWDAGNKISVYGTALTGTGENRATDMGELLKEAGDIALSYGYVKGEIVKKLGEFYLDNSPLSYGTGGLAFPESEIFSDDDTFEIVMTYAVETKFLPTGILTFRMANHYYGHIWNGYGGVGKYDTAAMQTVFVAENASVYHLDRSCTHLSLTIQETNLAKVEFERNAYGGKYYLCEKCGKGNAPEVLYVGIEGDRYHYRRDCPGLKRTVYSMTLAEARQMYRPCSRCSR